MPLHIAKMWMFATLRTRLSCIWQQRADSLTLFGYFLNRGTDINARDNKGQTPLLRAITWTNYLLYADGAGPLQGPEAGAGTRSASHSIPPRVALSNGNV